MGEIYSALKIFRATEQLRALTEDQLVAPVQVRIKPINACNHHCWFCAYRADNLELGEQMSLRDRIPGPKMDEIVSDLISMRIKAVTFSGGGEPLLYQRLPDVIERLALGGVRIGTLTNGSLLKGRVADTFAHHGTWIRVSIDAADGPGYAASRGLDVGAYAEVMQNLRSFVARGSKCALGASFIISEANVGAIEDFCLQARDAGLSSIKFSACVIGNTGRENNEYHSKIAKEAAKQLERAQTLAKPGFRVVDHYHRMNESFDKTYTRCRSMQFLVVIGSDCCVYSCQDKAYTDSGRLGSIKEQSFKEFWFSRENRERVRAIDPSRDCRHHCVSHRKNQLLTEYVSLDPAHADFV